jgi:hypothetical protein
MDYLYENLGDERFQEFCQSLIIKEFPNTQAFPVGQPDGGRDSVTYHLGTSKDFLVFQVKYVKNPFLIADPHKWLIDTLKGEIIKINRLIPKGAKKYYLITNVKGTAHLDTGSIDKVNDILQRNIAIPSMCWWRDDISRRIEINNDLKWSYTEILNGKDVLNSALFDHLNEHKEKRANVIKAYLADQYSLDDQVKFRQVDLQNRLLNLFTDVPIRIKKTNIKPQLLDIKLGRFYEKNMQRLRPIEENYIWREEVKQFGAAEFLLSTEIQNEFERILLEGGPGQGKSTISQYVSQVHRIHLLNKKSDLSILPDSLKKISVRLPFKIDLRHIAAWIENKNPYLAKLSEDAFSKIWQKSLESFMLGHILYHSQLDGFDKNDFIAICKLSPVLFVFDGFDEIANLKIREEVIDLINQGLERIKENSKSIQVLITSRPAAFVDSTSFSVENYPHFELTNITPAITKEYVEKWIRASRLDNREANEIRRLVQEKLEMPHLKDLAKSPMQLAIFISLLRKKGESLPNKRTALYDNYIELFFDRESEKSTIIRDNRDLIIDIHEYLGWILHSEAELYKSSGTIEIGALKLLLKDYLRKEGHETDITDKLFDVVKERVCALASRVQGTFEFEVQPLREYFCAKYLYKTSPYSPIGKEKPGTKPERFEAISTNYYWQNTVRFFAGCFDKGELPMLIQQLKELQENELLKYTNYPRILTSQILSDWVFTQYPILLKDVVKIIINGINIGNILNQDYERVSNNEPILLPKECGRIELVNECFNQLKTFPLSDYASELIGLIRNNPYSNIELWMEFAEQIKGRSLDRWLDYGYRMQILHLLNDVFLFNLLFKEEEFAHYRLQILTNAGKLSIVEFDLSLKQKALKYALNGKLLVANRQNQPHSLKFLSNCLRIFSLVSMIKNDEINRSYFDVSDNKGRTYFYHNEDNVAKQFDFEVVDDIDKKIYEYKICVKHYLKSDLSLWKTKIEPWDELVENGKKIFGDHWIFSIVATIGAGIQSRDEKFEDHADLDDSTLSLCKRVRSARMKSGNIKYWEQELQSEINLDLKLLIFFVWATPKVLVALMDSLSVFLGQLSDRDYKKIVDALRKLGRLSQFNDYQQKNIQEAVIKSNISDLLKYVLCFRMDEKNRLHFLYNNIDDKGDSMYDVLNMKLNYLIERFITDTSNEILLNSIKVIYNNLDSYVERYQFNRNRYIEDIEIPLKIAREIMSNCKQYPRIIASIAEKSCTLHAVKNAIPVGEIAKKNKWFD